MHVIDERKRSQGGISSLIQKLKSIKNIQIILVIFIIAIALIIYSSVMTSKGDNVGVMNDDEMRLNAILSSIDGVGEVESMITVKDGDIVGVLVIAEGGDNPLIRLRLIDASASALGVDKSIVSVFSKS